MVENCWGGSGYSAETPGRLGLKGLRSEMDQNPKQYLPCNGLSYIRKIYKHYLNVATDTMKRMVWALFKFEVRDKGSWQNIMSPPTQS